MFKAGRPVTVAAALLWSTALFGAEAKRPGDWTEVVQAAKKEGKIVIAVPPATELRKQLQAVLKRELNLDAELIPNPGPKNASRIAAEKKAGVPPKIR